MPRLSPDVQYPATANGDVGAYLRYCCPGHVQGTIFESITRTHLQKSNRSSLLKLIKERMVDLPGNVGWIGLGIMGMPMVRNLLAKMKDDTQFYVYDVVQESIDRLVRDGHGRVHACSSSKDVADNSVWQLCMRSFDLTTD